MQVTINFPQHRAVSKELIREQRILRWKHFAETWPIILLLITFGAVLFYRLGLESSVWVDETLSLYLTKYGLRRLFDLTSMSAHPPGYYIVLKAWIKGGSVLGIPESMLWARLLNGAVWLFLVMICFFVGRRVMGVGAGSLVMWSVAGGTVAANLSKEIRCYNFAATAVFVCFLALFQYVKNKTNDIQMRLAGWIVYALAAIVAVWSHSLTVIPLALMSFIMFLLVIGRRARQDLYGFIVVHVAILIGYLPWLIRVGKQFNYISSDPSAWRSPPTVANLLLVFTYWYPLGNTGLPQPGTIRNLLIGLGILSCAVPLAAALVVSVRRPICSTWSTPFKLAILSVGIATVNVLATWTIQRLQISNTFHGPRYPALTGYIWAIGLAAAAIAACDAAGWRRGFAWLLMMPWLVSSVLGHAITLKREKVGGLMTWKSYASDLVKRGDTVYAFPPELLPYYNESLKDYKMVRIEELPNISRDTATVKVLNLNAWRFLDRPRDAAMVALLGRNILSTGTVERRIPPWGANYIVYILSDYRHDAAAKEFATGIEPRWPEVPFNTVALARAQDQFVTDGFASMEMTPSLDAYRWGVGSGSVIRFDRPVKAGYYLLHLELGHPPFPQQELPLTFSVPGDTAAGALVVKAGEITADIPIHISRDTQTLRVKVSMPSWKPSKYMKSQDMRSLTFQFKHAWLVRSDE